MSSRAIRVLVCLVSVVAAVALPPGLHAQPSAAPLSPEAVGGLVEEAFELIRDHAVSAPDSAAVLTAAIGAVRQALASAGITPAIPPSPASAADLPVVRDYVRSAAALLPPPALETSPRKC